MIQSTLFVHSLKGLSLHNGPPIAYQQFVDDNLLFGHSSVHEARKIHSLLNTFEAASGTSLNLEKSQIFFFNTSKAAQKNISRILRFSISSLPTKYLGAPLFDVSLKHSS